MKYQRASLLVAKAGMKLTPLGQRFIARICECSAPEEMSDDETIDKINSVRMAFGRCTHDDDVFPYTRSPFDNNWYYFAAGIASGFSEKPYSYGSDRPDETGFIELLDEISPDVHLK